MIQIQNISFSYAGNPLYQDASFSVPKNKKAGLVGLNGAGKSTLFKLILQEEYPDDGKVITQGSVLLVPQEVKHDARQSKAKTIGDYLRTARTNRDDVLKKLLANMEMGHLSLDQSPNTLSGGQKTKLAILHAVLSEPDILLLDEPTNFLDTAGKKWIMHWLGKYKKTLLVVSHDLDLLDRHIDKVIYINKQTKSFEEYTGTYSQFKKLKSQHDEHLTRYIRNQEKRIKKMQKSVERLRRSNVEKVIRQRVQLEKRLQKMQDQLPEVPQEVVKIKLQLPTPARIGEIPLHITSLGKAYDDETILHDVDMTIVRDERVALIGHNGAGKSTLIKCIMGLQEPTSGHIKVDTKAKIGYYSQEFERFDYDMTLYDTVQHTINLSEGQTRAFLARFMFGQDKIRQRVGSLSGGEKTRLSIALLMLINHNFLILDEPTTYLDVMSQAIILEALKEYKGTLLVVSHTPDFLKGLKLDKVLLLPEEKFTIWSSEYANRAAEL